MPAIFIYASSVISTLRQLPLGAIESRSPSKTGSSSQILSGEQADVAMTFGEFRVDPLRRTLSRGQEVMRLPERLFGVLSLLVRSSGAVVEKETFATIAWPDAVMTDANLAQHIYKLRELLGETARDGTSILAVSGRGYRFTVPVRAEHASAKASKAAFETHAILLSRGLEPLVYHAQASRLIERGSAGALARAIDFLEAALRIDRNYTPALLGLARAHALLAERSFARPRAAFQTAKSAVAQALVLDPGSSMAHAIRAELIALDEWDWAGAEREIAMAAQLDPASTFVRSSAARLHIYTGSYDRAMIEAQLALMAEASSLTLLLILVSVFIHSGHYQHAIAILSNLLESDSDFHAARRDRAHAYLLDGRPNEAIGDLDLLAPDRSEELNGRLPLLARAYADSGDHGRAAEIYGQLLEASRAEYVADWNLAIVAAGLGRFDEATCHLEQALEAREPSLNLLQSLPWFKPISGSSRFKTILAQVGPR